MSDPTPSREEMMSAMFAHMVIQQTNMAMMLLGKVPHPQTGGTMRDLEAARLFIDQLEMLQLKTKGNLSKEEEAMLKQSLSSLQMMFVETSNEPEKTAAPEKAAPDKQAEPAEANPETQNDEAQKHFVKKY